MLLLLQVNEETITSLLEKTEEETPPPKRLKLLVPTGAKLAKMVGKLVLQFVLNFLRTRSEVLICFFKPGGSDWGGRGGEESEWLFCISSRRWRWFNITQKSSRIGGDSGTRQKFSSQGEGWVLVW